MMRSVQRILAIFESFSTERPSLTLQEIANKIDLPKSTAFRIVHSLEKAGYIVKLENLNYCLSFRFVRLAGLVMSTMGIRDIARPVLAELAVSTGETCSIHMLVGKERVCLDSVTASSPLRSVVQPGEHVPLNAGSATKVLIANLTKDMAMPLIDAVAKASGRTHVQISEELATVREKGYATSHGERLPGVSAISAPIYDIKDEVPYCLSVGGPSFRIQANESELILKAVAAAGTISFQFGGKMNLLDAEEDEDILT
ncbi:MAG: IclR family transcriptional regulator [Devosia sp.]